MKSANRFRSGAIALALLMFYGCAHQRLVEGRADQVRVEVTDVAYDHSTGTHYIVLQEKSGRRVLPITIGDDEARAIIFELHGIKPERPLTYELLLKIIGETGNRIDRVVIAEVHDQVYYAKVYIDGRYAVDSRPSDAIALAIGAEAPIFVADNLFQTDNSGNAPGALQTAEALGVTVQELTPELAQYFAVPVHSGVLVADIARNAQTAGLQRGDIVTQVDGTPVSTLAEFSRVTALAGGNSTVAFTVNRDRSTRVIMLVWHDPRVHS
jgi:uncharacterized protein